ncbi:MAG TPA: amidohydrolase family protein, partial [Ilumatobacteraceae bacterium]
PAADAHAYLARTRRRPLVHLDELGCLGPHVLVAHAVHVDDDEIDVLLERQVAVASCPWAYLRLGQGVSQAGRHAELVERGGRVALGCDSENAGDAIDVLRAATLTAGLAKDMRLDPEHFGARRAFGLATWAGAEAIGMAHEIGSLEPGKRADLVLVDTSGPEWVPLADDSIRQLVWASDGRSVRHVVASGRVVVRDGEPTLIDREALASEADAARQRLLSDAGLAR